jgi:CBS-domain-containing membrane protein
LAQPKELTQWWQRAQPLDRLRKQYPASIQSIDEAVNACSSKASDPALRWMPVQAHKTTGYVALVQANGTICGWLPLDGFF